MFKVENGAMQVKLNALPAVSLAFSYKDFSKNGYGAHKLFVLKVEAQSGVARAVEVEVLDPPRARLRLRVIGTVAVDLVAADTSTMVKATWNATAIPTHYFLLL